MFENSNLIAELTLYKGSTVKRKALESEISTQFIARMKTSNDDAVAAHTDGDPEYRPDHSKRTASEISLETNSAVVHYRAYLHTDNTARLTEYTTVTRTQILRDQRSRELR